ncbi:MAG: response regulator [Fuerstiella sp.]
MPSKSVLSIGQCRPDNAAITHFLTSNFDVEVLATDLAEDSLTALQKNSVDLILINRKLDTDYSDGMEIMKLIKSNPQTEQIPVMLISNFPESQEQAVAAGATYGFGKAELSSRETVERVKDALGLA